MSELKGDLHETIADFLREENPEETADAMLTSWAVVGYFEPLGESEHVGFIAVTGSASPVTSVGLLRMGERYLIDD